MKILESVKGSSEEKIEKGRVQLRDTRAKVLEHAQNFHLEFVYLVAGKNRFAYAPLPSTDLAQRKYWGLSKKVRCYNQDDYQTQYGHILF